ncbi:hypothetical protein [Phenylobacterium sp. J367]|uniref:hypothetical protein n=1 Tax=Phenylobacterium sp. J367 TaxID=2898435 RepID=UPI0021515030|nr:hypothetical protein [Phenylobacterium sp. J367]MCR5877636.1 hypothetical protein [Phenylobacterium sp. J367]
MAAKTQPITEVMAACATELADLAGACEVLQTALSDAMAAGLADGQALDLITQRAAGLAQFLAALGRELPSDWRVDSLAAAQGVTLADLARSLTGHDSQAAAETGELDLFGG